MNFGVNLYDWFSTNAQQLVLAGIACAALYFIVQRKTTELIATIIIAIIAVGFAFNTSGAKDAMLAIFNTVIGAGS